MRWQGVIPAITTEFKADLSVDIDRVVEHARWMMSAGSTGIVALGSLGEGATLTADEKRAILQSLVRALPGTPVVAGISALSTLEAITLAKEAAELGCAGLMVLPPYVYSTDWREMKAHIDAVLRCTPLSCMLYNNPVAYKTDFLPEQIAELAAEHANLHAVKESSADVRRVTAIKALLGDRLAVFVGVDDVIVEGVRAGAVGWIAGLVNAFPHESVKLFELAGGTDTKALDALYHWFLPVLRTDTVPKFVQLIKLAQQEVGRGSERVRPPRLVLAGAERDEALGIIRAAVSSRPKV